MTMTVQKHFELLFNFNLNKTKWYSTITSHLIVMEAFINLVV